MRGTACASRRRPTRAVVVTARERWRRGRGHEFHQDATLVQGEVVEPYPLRQVIAPSSLGAPARPAFAFGGVLAGLGVGHGRSCDLGPRVEGGAGLGSAVLALVPDLPGEPGRGAHHPQRSSYREPGPACVARDHELVAKAYAGAITPARGCRGSSRRGWAGPGRRSLPTRHQQGPV